MNTKNTCSLEQLLVNTLSIKSFNGQGKFHGHNAAKENPCPMKVFAFLYKPIVYCVARSLYGVATSDSVLSYLLCVSKNIYQSVL